MKKLISVILRNIPRPYLQTISPPLFKIAALLMRGNRYTCPIENKSYRKFLPYGRMEARPNALCPGSMSLERHRLIWLYLKNKTNFFTNGLKFLHIAPEACFIDRFEAIHTDNYITGDLESPLAKVKLDVHKLPFEDGSFDALMCNHVLEHVESDFKAMSEFYRVLKPGGWAILQVPFTTQPIPEKTFEDPSITNPQERERIFGQDDHVRVYGKDYADRIRSVGFEVREDDYVKTFSAEDLSRYCLPREEVIFYCRKS